MQVLLISRDISPNWYSTRNFPQTQAHLFWKKADTEYVYWVNNIKIPSKYFVQFFYATDSMYYVLLHSIWYGKNHVSTISVRQPPYWIQILVPKLNLTKPYLKLT